MLCTNFQPSDPSAAVSENISFVFSHFAGKPKYEIGENGNFGEKVDFNTFNCNLTAKKLK